MATAEGDITSVFICRNGPKLTRLLFADDSLIFCKAKVSECQKITGNTLNLQEHRGGK